MKAAEEKRGKGERGREPRERPILFSGPMVQALLAGRKTQTRRLIVPLPTLKRGWWHWKPSDAIATKYNESFKWKGGKSHLGKMLEPYCAYGRAGDRLWVREAWFDEIVGDEHNVAYRATNAFGAGGLKWKPPIFMPRWASRLTLEIARVRVEQVQDISAEDCKAEGLVHEARGMWSCPGTEEIFDEGFKGYRWLWNSIVSARPWNENHWVWVLEFRMLTPEPDHPISKYRIDLKGPPT